MADLKSIVGIATRRAASGVVRREFGRGALVTANSKAGAADAFADFASIAGFYDATTDEDRAVRREASLWFSKSGAKNLVIIAHSASRRHTIVTGGDPDSASAIAALSGATFTLGDVDATGLDPAGANYTALATDIETDLQAFTVGTETPFADYTVTVSGGKFILTLVNTGATDDPGPPTGTLATALGLTEERGARYVEGIPGSSSVSGTLSAASRATEFTIVLTDITTAATVDDISVWCEADDYMFLGTTTDPDDLDSANANALADNERDHTVLGWEEEEQGLMASVGGLMSGVNFRGTDTVPTLKFTQHGVTPADLDQSRDRGTAGQAHQPLRELRRREHFPGGRDHETRRLDRRDLQPHVVHGRGAHRDLRSARRDPEQDSADRCGHRGAAPRDRPGLRRGGAQRHDRAGHRQRGHAVVDTPGDGRRLV